MTRRIRRSHDYEITVQIANDAFIRPPREAQRSWLLNKAIGELVDELTHYHRIAPRFAAGVETLALAERDEAALTDAQIMEDWQIPIMQAMAGVAAAPDRDLLEIGFGRGVASTMLQQVGVRSHTIVECNASVIERYHGWRAQYPTRAIQLIPGLWQDVTDQFGQYDSIFFHTYALSEDEYLENAVKSVTFAAHFFATASAHLRPGGVFTYLTNEIDSLSRAHQRAILDHFSSFSLRRVEGLAIPGDVKDTWWADSMMVIGAVK